MTLYHATPIENKESIEKHGLSLMVTDKITYCDDQITDEGVFGFVNIEDAQDFGSDCCGGEYAIFSFETESAIIDPVYDGEAFFTTDVSSLKFVGCDG
jgi:hypothetical protein